MIASDLARACLVSLIPVLAFTHHLNFTWLYMVALAAGTLSVVFDTSFQAYVPSLVERDRLVQANSSMQFSSSLASIGGPGTAGLLVGLLTAPYALVVDSFTFLVSAVSLLCIRKEESVRLDTKREEHFWKGIREGLTFLYGHPVLAQMTLAMGGIDMFFNAFLSVYYLYLNRDAGLSPSVMGFVLSGGAVGALLGALFAGHLSKAVGLGRTVALTESLFAVAAWLVPLAHGPAAIQVLMFTCAAVMAFFGGYSGAVTATSLRQRATPDALLGRVGASAQIVLLGLSPIGALLGGALGQIVGHRYALMAAASGISLMVIWLWLSPLGSHDAGAAPSEG